MKITQQILKSFKSCFLQSSDSYVSKKYWCSTPAKPSKLWVFNSINENTPIQIVQTFGNPNPNGAGTSLVRKEFFTDTDPYVITRLYVCPLCKGKLGFKGM